MKCLHVCMCFAIKSADMQSNGGSFFTVCCILMQILCDGGNLVRLVNKYGLNLK